LKWFGNVVQMCGTRTVKRLLGGKGEGKKERSRLTRMEDVGKYLRNMGVKRRRTRTLEGTEWASKEL